jgi:hypothetical protein
MLRTDEPSWQKMPLKLIADALSGLMVGWLPFLKILGTDDGCVVITRSLEMEIALEMPMAMTDNEMIFFVNLAKINGFSPTEAIVKLQSMGYKPDLKLYRWKSTEKEYVEACALLHREISDDVESVFSSFEPKFWELSSVFGDSAVYLAMGNG